MRLSVVVPVYNEAESLEPLIERVSSALAGFAGEWELILVDDGSSDATPTIAARAAGGDSHVRLVQLSRNCGQTAAMTAGFHHARGEMVVTMDGDLQNDPADIPALLAKLDQGYDLVTGWRRDRQDKLLTRKVPSWIANRLIAWMTGIPIRDNGCSLKAYRRALLDRVALYSDMHRFIPAFAALAGARIAQLPVRHHARRFGVSKYGLGRTFRVLADVATIRMLTRFRERPLLGFAWLAVSAGTIAGLFGAAWGLALAQFRTEKAAALVLPGSAFIWLCTAVFLFMLGVIAEAVVGEHRERSPQTTPLAREWHGPTDT